MPADFRLDIFVSAILFSIHAFKSAGIASGTSSARLTQRRLHAQLVRARDRTMQVFAMAPLHRQEKPVLF
jgi:hypothetical protein